MQRLRVPILFVVSNLSKKALIAKKGVGTGRSGRESASGFSLLSVWAYLFAAMKINSLVRKAATSRGHLFRLDVVAPGPQLSRSGTHRRSVAAPETPWLVIAERSHHHVSLSTVSVAAVVVAVPTELVKTARYL